MDSRFGPLPPSICVERLRPLMLSDQYITAVAQTASCNRAESAQSIIAAAVISLRQRRPFILTIIIALLSVSLIIAYGGFLSGTHVAASTSALLIVLLAATLSSIAGFAFSAICGVMLLQVVSDPLQAVEIMMVCSIAIQSVSVVLLWRDIEWRRLSIFLIGGPVGLPFGVALLLNLDPHTCRHVIGALLTAYAAWVLLKRPMTMRWGGNAADIAMGFLGGVTGGLAGFPGATVAAWCGLKGWDKHRQRGVYQPFILIMQILALGLIQVSHSAGTHNTAISLVDLAFIPPALIGTMFGLTLFAKLSDRHFALIVNTLLLVSGLGLLL